VEDIASAIDALKGRADALYVATDPLVFNNRVRINALAQDARLPTIFGAREYVDAGGLLSYGPNWTDLFRRAAEQVDKILRGAKPADIPVEQPTKFNLKTAKALGLTVPPSVLARRRGDRVGSRRVPVMARSGICGAAAGCPLSEAKRKTSAQCEYFAF
jgi:putative ABC transport system substrate-binding protein